MLTARRRHLLTKPVLKHVRKASPGLSETEREALETGDVCYGPEHPLCKRKILGITVALISTHLQDIETGRRHLPSYQMFQNRPNWGKDVFIPLDFVIGGQSQIGKGWKMLMVALAAKRDISLPPLSVSGTVFATRTTGAYARIRQQFHIPIGKFEDVQTRLGKLAATCLSIGCSTAITLRRS
jgi:acyl-CoA dehydrogenase